MWRKKPMSPSLTEHKTEGKERVSFGTRMSTKEEVSKSGSEAKEGKQVTTAIERFHARKIGAKVGRSADKRAVLKVLSSGGVQKQKTPNKSSMQNVVQALEQDGLEELINQMTQEVREPMEVAKTGDVTTPKLVPKNLMGSQDEARQEQ
jgi:ribosomal protein L12E/L44/L45/RPP1/RPP2